MSVIGIDFGNESCFVAVARAGGIETVDNDYSLRATSSTVAFGEKQRVLGVAAKNQLTTNIKNTVTGFKRFLGRRFDDPIIQEQVRKQPFKMVPHPDNGAVAIQVRYLGEESVFTAEQIAAMLFTKLKIDTETAIKVKISDCVISVPSYFTDAERRALLGAAQMAGLNVLRTLNETSATALSYGIYRQDLPLPEEKPRNVIFVDCGHSALQISACAFNKGKLKMLASAADPYLGGRDFDRVLAAHFCAEFQQKYKINTESNHRAYVRLLTEVEKLKKQMSANATKLPLNIECLMDDKDVSSSLCRADFEAMSADLFQRVEVALRKCLVDSKLQLDEIHSVEIVGGSSRIPAIKQLIEVVFGKVPSTTLNQDEAVARGCALQCAILSPSYKVRDFSITDVQPYPIKLIWDESAGEDGYTEVFPQYHPVPFSRMLTFYRHESFSLKAMYNALVPFPTPELGSYTIKNVNPVDGENVKIKVKARINLNGIFSICSATAYEKTDAPEVESMETEPPQETEGTNANCPTVPEQGDGTPNNTANEIGNDVPMTQDEVVTETSEDKKKGTKKQQFKTQDLPLESVTFGLSQRDIDLMTESEGKMIAEDRMEKERIDAKNALEEYIYNSRDKLTGELSDYVEDSVKSQLSQNLNELEHWLYEDGGDEKKNEYNFRLDTLKKTIEPLKEHRNDALNRPKALQTLEVSMQLSRKIVDMYKNNDPRYAHLEPSEVDKVIKAIGESQIWLERTREILHSVKGPMVSPINSDEIQRQRVLFESISAPILGKQKPKVKPPKEEPKKDENSPCQDDGKSPPTPNENNHGNAEMEVE